MGIFTSDHACWCCSNLVIWKQTNNCMLVFARYFTTYHIIVQKANKKHAPHWKWSAYQSICERAELLCLLQETASLAIKRFQFDLAMSYVCDIEICRHINSSRLADISANLLWMRYRSTPCTVMHNQQVAIPEKTIQIIVMNSKEFNWVWLCTM